MHNLDFYILLLSSDYLIKKISNNKFALVLDEYKITEHITNLERNHSNIKAIHKQYHSDYSLLVIFEINS